MAKQPRENPKHMTKIGGQALIEGVMMKGADTGAMACRLPNGEIDVETWKENNGKNMPWYRKCPFLRGSFNFVLSMKDGYRCLTKSAEKQVPEDEDEEDTEEMNRFEKWLDEKLGDKLFGIIMSIGMVVGIAVAIGLFVFLPKFLIGQLIANTAIPDNSRFVRSLLEGIIKIAIFLGYMACTGMMKDIRRTYEYHGAEHKTIACYEAGEELTVENVKKHTRFHPRCGTSFLIIVMLISILFFMVVRVDNVLLRMASRILGMGDVLSLIERAQDAADEKAAEETARRMMENKFDMNDMLAQFAQIRKMGGAGAMLSMMPGMSGIDASQIDEKAFDRIEAMIYSMTKEEREKPSIINPKRKRRIAAGSGTRVEDVNKLLKQFEMMQKMMKQFKKSPKGFARRLGGMMGNPNAFRGLK